MKGYLQIKLQYTLGSLSVQVCPSERGIPTQNLFGNNLMMAIGTNKAK